MLNASFGVPTAVGWNCTPMVQVSEAASVWPVQVSLTIEYGAASGLPAPTVPITRSAVAVALLVTVTVCVGEVAPTAMSPKATVRSSAGAVESVTTMSDAGTGVPVPLRFTITDASSVSFDGMSNASLTAPTAAGRKRRSMVQDAAAASVWPEQPSVVMLNEPASGLSTATVPMTRSIEPSLVTVTVCALA